MKKIIPLFIIGMFLNPLNVYSVENEIFNETINDTTFTYMVDNSTNAVIIECSSNSEEIIIPSLLGGYEVTSIGDKAFFGNISLNSIIIPDSITHIGDNAFSGCLYLESINLPKNLTYIGKECFTSCTSLEYVKVGNLLTSFPERCFSSCTSLIEINIPDSITSIGEEAFFGCSDISDIFIPPTVNEIGNNAFGMYYNIRNNGIEKIKNFRIRGLPETSASEYADNTGIEIYNKLGDINCDGFINSVDASIVLYEYSILSIGEKSTFDQYQQYVGDYSKDSVIDAIDSALILQEYTRLQVS